VKKRGELANRSILKATFTPLKRRRISNPEPDSKPIRERAWEKWNFIRTIRPSNSELEIMKKGLVSNQPSSKAASMEEVNSDFIDKIRYAVPKLGPPNPLRNVRKFAELDVNQLIDFGKRLLSVREENVREIMKDIDIIIKEFESRNAESQHELRDSSSENKSSVHKIKEFGNHYERTSPLVSMMPLKEVMEWAFKNNIRTSSFDKILELADELSPDNTKVTVRGFKLLVSEHVRLSQSELERFLEEVGVEPVGFLLLLLLITIHMFS
jgi:hypothetical protein